LGTDKQRTQKGVNVAFSFEKRMSSLENLQRTAESVPLIRLIVETISSAIFEGGQTYRTLFLNSLPSIDSAC
jgi:hypothetical protein